jgi:hypothetical protein
MRPTLPAITLALAAVTSAAHGAPTVFYLHGKFVEEHGAGDVHPQHGPYRYREILAALGRDGAEVVSEVRPRDTDVSDYADRIVAAIRARLQAGQPARDITVVGASKGAVIAALVSSRLGVDDARFVLMGACNDWLESAWAPRFTGHVLSIFDDKDDIAGSCATIAARSRGLAEYREIELHTGLGHGFLYTPREAWMAPARDWISRR